MFILRGTFGLSPFEAKARFRGSRYPKEGLRASSMAQAPLRPCWLTPRRPVPRIAGLCRAGLIDMLAPKTATYEYRADPRRRPGVYGRSVRGQVTHSRERLSHGSQSF